MLYFALTESSGWRASIGKRWLGLFVEDTRGRRISLSRALLRNGLKLLPWEVAHASIWRIPGIFSSNRLSGNLPLGVEVALVMVYVIGAAYAISVVLTPRGQAIYDLIAGTVVGRRQSA